MVTMIRNLFRHIGESLKSLKRNGWMTLASVSAVTITLVLVGLFLALILNVTKLAKDVESAVDVSIFVEIGSDQKELDALKTELEALPNVTKVEFSNKEDQYKRLVEKFGENFKLFEDDENPFYDVFIVSAKTPDDIKVINEKARSIKNVARAEYGGGSADKIFKLADGVKKWGFIAAGLLLFVAIFLISNTIRITIISRKREIQIMRLVGAKNSFIRWPFFLEGAWIGMLGSIVPVLLMSFGYTQVYLLLSRNLITFGYTLLAPNDVLLTVNTVMIVIGVLIGSLGSTLSMSRFLKV